MKEYIYYTGKGANQDGKHTTEEFLHIMNTQWNIDCSKFAFEMEASRTYKPCLQSSEMMRKYRKNNTKRKTPEKEDKQFIKKWEKLSKQCRKYIKRGTLKRNCNVDEYVLFSGAQKKK